jgi:hypothetical protein
MGDENSTTDNKSDSGNVLYLYNPNFVVDVISVH